MSAELRLEQQSEAPAAPRRRGIAPASKPRLRGSLAARLLVVRSSLARIDRQLTSAQSGELDDQAEAELQDCQVHIRALRTRLLTAAITLTAE